MNWRTVTKMLGGAMIAFAAMMVVPSIVAAAEGEWGSLRSFVVSAAIAIAIGAGLRWYGGEQRILFRREALLVVAMSWVIIPLIGAMPFLMDGVFPNVVDAIFESVSGFTTTGSTILTEIEDSMSRSMHFWRMMTHWLGGMGIMVLFVAVLPSLGVGGKMLFKNEVPGPITEGLAPRVRETSIALWRVYIGLTVACAALLWAFTPMDVIDAIGHAMSTLGTGGFSSQNESVAGFHSPAAETIIIVFMFLAGVNFSLYFLVFWDSWRSAIKDRELWAYTALVVVASVIVSLTIIPRHTDLIVSLRHGTFQVLSIVTTTGFGTDDFDQYPALSRNLLFMLMFVGGSAGSTAGGIKIFRFIVLVRSSIANLTKTFQPHRVLPVRVNDVSIGEPIVASISTFFFAYMFVFVVGALIMSTMLPDLESAMSATIACLGNVGPGLGVVGPTQNFGFLPDGGKLLLSFLMICGRLELFAFLVILTPAFWRQ